MAIRDLLVFAITFGSLPFILKRPYIGVLVFTWLGYMNPHRLSWGIAYSFPFSALVGGVTIISFFLANEPKKFPRDRVLIFWSLFVGWCFLTYLFALNPLGAESEAIRFFKIQVILYLILVMFATRQRLILFVGVAVASIGFYPVKGGIFTLATAGNFMVLGPPDSFITGNTEIGFASVVVLPLMFFFRSQLNNKWLKIAVLISVFFSCLGIVGTHSRGAFLAFLVLSTFLIIKSNKKFLAIVVVVLALPIIFSVMPDKYFNKMETIETYDQDASAMGRINAWWFAFNLANDRPLTGGGFNTFTKELFYRYAPEPENFHDAHSIYFEVLGEQGYPGLIFFLLMLVFSYRNCAQVVQKTRGDPNMTWAFDLGRMLEASFVSYCVGGAFLGLAYFDLLYHLVGLTVLLKVVVDRELSEKKITEEMEDLAVLRACNSPG